MEEKPFFSNFDGTSGGKKRRKGKEGLSASRVFKFG